MVGEIQQDILITIRAMDLTKNALDSSKNRLKQFNEQLKTSEKVRAAVSDSMLRERDSIMRQIPMLQGQFAQQRKQLALRQKLASQIDIDKTKNMGFFEVLMMNFDAWRGMNEAQIGFTKTGGKTGNIVRNLTHGMRGFRMEMLGVMFFGMGMQRMFMGLLQPALETAGVFELISLVLELMFLPIALLILELLFPFIEWFINLPEPVRLAAGALALFGVILGTALFFIGTMALGLGSLIQLFGLIGSPILAAIGVIGTLISVLGIGFLLTVIGLIIASLALLFIAFKENGAAIMRAIDGVFNVLSDIFDDIRGVISGFIDFFVAIVNLDAKGAVEALKKIFKNGLKLIEDLFWKLPNAIADVLAQILVGIARWVTKLPEFILSFGPEIWKAFMDLIPTADEFAKQIQANMGNAIKNALNALFPGLSLITGAASIVQQATTPSRFNVSPSVSAPFKTSASQASLTSFTNKVLLGKRFQHGGIVTSPTVGFLGESGPEAVVPLGKEGMLSPTINITVNASTAMGVTADEIASVVERRLGNEFRRLGLR